MVHICADNYLIIICTRLAHDSHLLLFTVIKAWQQRDVVKTCGLINEEEKDRVKREKKWKFHPPENRTDLLFLITLIAVKDLYYLGKDMKSLTLPDGELFGSIEVKSIFHYI